MGNAILNCKYLSDLIENIDIREFIELRRFETLSLHHVLQGIKISKCKWLGPACTNDNSKKHKNVNDSLKRLEIFEEFVFWYFSSFLLPLLSVGFLFFPTSDAKRIVVSLHSM